MIAQCPRIKQRDERTPGQRNNCSGARATAAQNKKGSHNHSDGTDEKRQEKNEAADEVEPRYHREPHDADNHCAPAERCHQPHVAA